MYHSAKNTFALLRELAEGIGSAYVGAAIERRVSLKLPQLLLIVETALKCVWRWLTQKRSQACSRWPS